VIVVSQAVGNLVENTKSRMAHQAGLPKSEHIAAQCLAVVVEFLGRELHAVALVEQARDLHLSVDQALAPDLGRMRREHRHAHRLGEEGLQSGARDAGLASAD
jgi:hypothetical protein